MQVDKKVNIPQWAPRLFLILGGVLFVGGSVWTANQLRFSSKTESTDGKIIGMVGISNLAPVVEYSVAGVRYTHEGVHGSQN